VSKVRVVGYLVDVSMFLCLYRMNAKNSSFFYSTIVE
jgi:hypothetical protein